MIPITDAPETTFDTAPVKRIDMTQMDAESMAFMFANSRDGFYSNKELAPIREYSTNARDAHIQSGIGDIPIHVTLPSQMAPELRIRDFGKGLTIEQMEDVYFRYWKSSKRNDNTVNGCLGIGSKSAFAYAPSYTIVSWCGGMKTIATGQKTGYADVIFHEANTANEPDGIEIVISIQQKDINKFIHEALEFFKYWDVRPVFHNIEPEKLKEAFHLMDVEPFISGEGWAVRPSGYGSSEAKAVMGFVPYSIDWEQVKNSMAPEVAHKVSGIFDFLQENLTALYFPMGDLAFTPNRETLQYNDVTVKSLSNKIVAIYESLLSLITNKIADAPSIWEAKIRYNKIFRRELDGFEKNEMYKGNLQTLENILRNRVLWRGITIANGYFEELDNWDVIAGKVDVRFGRPNGYQSVFDCYVKNDDLTGVESIKRGPRGRGRGRRRYHSYGYESKIICSPLSLVVIDDMGSESDAKALAHWLLYKADKGYKQIYVLNLSNPNTKALFFRQYAFDTVPVSYVSKNIQFITAYKKSIRAPRQPQATRESRPTYCPYVVIENRRKGSYVSNPMWNYENVNARGVEGGGFYVVKGKNSFTYNGREIEDDNSNQFWQAIYELALLNGEMVPKVYGIAPRSADAVWFKEAIKDGSWTNLADWVKNHIEVLPDGAIKRVRAYYRRTDGRLGTVTANLVMPHIANENGVFAEYAKMLTDIPQYNTVKDLPTWLRLDGYEPSEDDNKFWVEANANLRKAYPLMFRIGDGNNIPCADGNNKYHWLSEAVAHELAEYVNLIDARNKNSGA